MSTQYYDEDDDGRPRSPPLFAVNPRATPSPSPPPFVTPQASIPTAQNVSPLSSRRRKKPNRRKTRPSQGDFVLIRVMEPNRPDIARQVGERALNSDSDSEADDDEMDEPPQTAETASSEPAQTRFSQPNAPTLNLQANSLQATALKALTTTTPTITNKIPPPPRFEHRDSVVEADSESRDTPNEDGASQKSSTAGPLTNGVRWASNGADSKSPLNGSSKFDATSPILTGERRGSHANGYPHEDSLATSPNLRELTIPQSRGPPSQKLPALQNSHSPSRDGPGASPNRKQSLPGFQHLDKLAATAISEQQESRANGYPHRQSISSTGQSPTQITRALSISSALSPASAFPLSATSPQSASSDIGTRDPFLRSSQNSLFSNPRRPSQASENGPPYSGTLASASTNDSYQSSDGLSPGSAATPIEARTHRMSIDGAMASRTLPLPNGPHIQHIPPHGSGGFKCDYPNCNAAPFQTQYLLNSHANVHSQSRPHYCPVAGCPRGENGKGFKRKNEMIRHGLVHASPGYVCPFCPDREHKYPRPDNLQRHVRVHHVDKDKDDPQLREVLAQRPEGGSRGRRRRVGE
ncbi:hypothetical protein BCR34DRAFT_581955 [Clohesyomyces aquaticus]|uniref:C2H2-type domain-containing protein n=1 Tax=Clohesyomyces aquaticus TaxID=1231657 RepID=A0A1Y2AB38_9PLEO|nr:hypothetical protein BCR34DRAFT_581955 [Clohesyomyces aquaticus]